MTETYSTIFIQSGLCYILQVPSDYDAFYDLLSRRMNCSIYNIETSEPMVHDSGIYQIYYKKFAVNTPVVLLLVMRSENNEMVDIDLNSLRKVPQEFWRDTILYDLYSALHRFIDMGKEIDEDEDTVLIESEEEKHKDSNETIIPIENVINNNNNNMDAVLPERNNITTLPENNVNKEPLAKLKRKTTETFVRRSSRLKNRKK